MVIPFTRRVRSQAIGICMALLPIVAACQGSGEAEIGAPPSARASTLVIGAYTTPREVFSQEILPSFAAHWREETGEAVSFEESYAGSGAQARAVIGGFKADVVALSLEPDVQRVAEAGLITHAWEDGPHGGIVSRSFVVLAVRPGNPKGLRGWEDLARPDVKILTPNVRTSGGAMWNVAAIWGAALRGHAGAPAGDEAAATALLAKILRNVEVMDKGARDSILTFERGIGDVAITYENEVLVAQRAGEAMEYLMPSSTILIESPAAVVDVYAQERGNLEVAQAFVRFLHGPVAQQAYARYGLRPVDERFTPQGLAAPADAFTIRDLGGWAAIQASLFADGGAYDQALAAARRQ